MKAILILCSLLLALTTEAQTQTKKSKRMLVTYFSIPETEDVDASTGASRIVVSNQRYGTTEYVAKVIANTTGADLFQIKTTHQYPSHSHKELIDYAKKEAATKTYPAIASQINNFADYEVIFVGYPNWWYDMPMVIYSLFRQYDFSGKTIVPFCTHGGSGFSKSVRTIESLEKKAKVRSMPAISRDNATQAGKSVETWLRKQGFAQ